MLKSHLALFYTHSSFLSNPDSLISNPVAIRNKYKSFNAEADSVNALLIQMKLLEDKLMINRLQSRENYSSQIFRFNWIIMVVAIIFLSTAFILLDRELGRNRMYRIDLENKVENLNRSNSELEQFAYIASHDLQEPLRKIRSFADRIIVKYRQDLSEDAYQMLTKVDKSAQRMQILISDLLFFSRIVKTGSQPKTLNLYIPFSDAKANLSEMIMENKAVIHCEALPVMEVYPSQIVQLFQNLLSNSIKYQKENQRPVIRITHREVNGDMIQGVQPAHRNIQFHQIKLMDNGIGFKKEFSEKIFVIFQRLHGRNKFDGTGIGLAICKRVVSNHNGYIFAESNDGEGACFYIYLPVESLL